MISTDPWIWLSALLSLSCFSLLYGDNKFFRWAETTYTAVVVGHSCVTGFTTIRDRFYPLMTGENPLLIIALILGILNLFVVWRKYSWLATVSLSLMIGVGTGLSLRALMATDILGNTKAVIGETAKLLVGPPINQLGYFLRIVFTISSLFYFLFTVVPKGRIGKPLSYIATLGKYALLMYMGCSLGNTYQQFIGTATSAIYRLTGLWLGLG